MTEQYYRVTTYKTQDSIGYLTKRAHSLILNVLEPVLVQKGFSFVQYVILSWLRDGIAVNPKDICFQYRHNSGALTRVIDQLAERGLVERTRRDKDRRKVELQLTNQGRVEIEGLVPIVVNLLNKIFAPFTEKEVQHLLSLTVKLNDSLQAFVDQSPRSAPAL